MSGAGRGAFQFERLHHVQLAIPGGREDSCRAFWGDVLGMIWLPGCRVPGST